MQLLDAQWECSRYTGFFQIRRRDRSVLLAPGVSGRHGGRAGSFGQARERG
jgi:hypothetical protein